MATRESKKQIGVRGEDLASDLVLGQRRVLAHGYATSPLPRRPYWNLARSCSSISWSRLA
jgi:hypothetical protein